MQVEMFEHVAGAYGQVSDGRLTQEDLYRIAAGRAGIPKSALGMRSAVGRAGTAHNLTARQIRWHQQTLKQLGLIEKVDGMRGVWQLTEAGNARLRPVRNGVCILGFSTDLGLAIWGSAETVFGRINEPICLALTSPPYPLRESRAYGNVTAAQYTDFITRVLEPIAKNLVDGGSIVINLSNDIFEPESPARSLYLERLTLALCDRLGLSLMDRIVWTSNKPPGPLQWASRTRQQLNAGYEPILWLCNNPTKCMADNRRVLEPHSERHRKLVESGGERTRRMSGDGAYRIREGSFSSATDGSIPRNVMHVGNHCSSQRLYKQRARERGLQAHGAPMPLALARKLVRFLSDVGQLVVDPFAGSMTTPLAAEMEQRPWLASEAVYDYVKGGGGRFATRPGFRGDLGGTWDC